MRQFISGKWWRYDLGAGQLPLYLAELYIPMTTGQGTRPSLIVENIDDPSGGAWQIGQKVTLNFLIRYQFTHNIYASGFAMFFDWISNQQISITMNHHPATGTPVTFFYDASSFGFTGLAGEVILPVSFYPEDFGLTPGVNQIIDFEVEAFADYGKVGPQETGLISNPPYDDSLSVEKNGDRPVVYPTGQCNLEIILTGEVKAIQTSGLSKQITVASTTPRASFTYTMDPETGEAPLRVAFTNTSVAVPAIYAVRWYFGDGADSTSAETGFDATVNHIYEQPGTYTVTLTVTNGNGPGRTAVATETIVVTGGATNPKFVLDLDPAKTQTKLPAAISPPGSNVALQFNVKNEGAAGNIWLKSTSDHGTIRTLIASVAIDAYSVGKIITPPAHNLEWYAGYKPTLDNEVDILFSVGPVGSTVTDTVKWTTFESTTSPDHNCATGYHWDATTQACVKDTTPGTGSFWSKYGSYVIIGGLGTAAILAGLIAMSGKKK